MMKFVNSDTTTKSLRHGEQYENCSELLIEPDMTSLEELDPSILSCGLPAIVLKEDDPTAPTMTSTTTATTTSTPHPSSLMVSCSSFSVAAANAVNVIRYTVANLLFLRRSPLSHRRPTAIDDPRTGQYPIWSRTGFNQQQQPDRVRRVSNGNGDEELLSGAYGRRPNDRQRDNGYNPPRFRRNYEFSNRNHHVIVKSYNAVNSCGAVGGAYTAGGAMRLQDTIIEEEPEWVSAGPTSRLDTIELRGFDEDVSRNVAESLKTSPVGGKTRTAFFDELLHYEHVHPKHGAKHDLSGGAGDGESVSTSNTGSPPPARSTPTKGDFNNNHNGHGSHGRKMSGGVAGPSSAAAATGGGGVNVSNFEELMKFDSILGDSGDSNSSRFSKFYRRGGSASGSSSAGGHHYQHQYGGQQHSHHQQHQQHHVRFALDRNTHHYNNGHQTQQQQQHRQAGSGRLPMSALQPPPAGTEQCFPGGSTTTAQPNVGDAKSFQRLLDMLALQNQRTTQHQQQQHLLQLLQNCQETETLRQMLMKKCTLDNAAAMASGQQRIPTQAELQQHTQSIMKQALLRKKIAEQSRYLLEQQQQQGGQEPIPAVQQLIQSFCPNVQRKMNLAVELEPFTLAGIVLN
uniref:Uncharacterized protein n=1 Tax=Anopheles epiroticus TaxID=199890 RepID=A0A182P8Q4_9DIPT